MLSSNDLSTLYRIISDDNQTFENISKTLKDSFTRTEIFKLGLTLCILLKDNLLNLSQRIISYYILYELKKNEKLEVTPFFPLILEFLNSSKNKTEQSFLIDFIYEEIDYLKLTIKNYIQDTTKTTSKFNNSCIPIIMEKYFKMLNNCNDNNIKNNSISSLNNINNNGIKDHIRNIIYDRKKKDIKNLDNYPILNLNNLNIIINEELNYKFFEPNYMSFFPLKDISLFNIQKNNVHGINNNKIFTDEPFWLIPELKHTFIWEKKNRINEKETNKSEGNEDSK